MGGYNGWKKKKKKNNEDIKINVQITLLIIFSILLGVMIFSESGLLGKSVSTILGRSNELG